MKRIVFLSLFLLLSCGPVYRTEYTIVPPQTEQGRMCANNCLMSQQNCRQSCQLQAQNCQHMDQLQSQNDYLMYLNERQRQGKPIKRDPYSFGGGSSCYADTMCEERCAADYRICHVNCGGQAIPQTMCVAGCR